jgi:hypothetical protein
LASNAPAPSLFNRFSQSGVTNKSERTKSHDQNERTAEQRQLDIRFLAAGLVIQLPRDEEEEALAVLDYARLLVKQFHQDERR